MDTLRGAAIVLVLFHHAVDLPVLLSGVTSPSWIRAIDVALLPYRMPMLFLLSGMLLDRALAKPLPKYYLGKVRTLVWPYVIWAAVFFAVVRREEPPAWNEWIATSWLWYIFYLGCYFLIAPALARLPIWIPPLAFWAASAIVTDPTATTFLVFAGFFFTGRVLWRERHRATAMRHPAWIAGGVVLLAAFSAAYVLQDRGVHFLVPLRHEELIYMPLTILAVCVLIMIARLIPDSRVSWLQFIGRNAIVFYLTHYPLQITITYVLADLSIMAWQAHLIVGMVVPLVLGIVIARLRPRPFVEVFFVMPWPGTKPRGALAGATDLTAGR